MRVGSPHFRALTILSGDIKDGITELGKTLDTYYKQSTVGEAKQILVIPNMHTQRYDCSQIFQGI